MWHIACLVLCAAPAAAAPLPDINAPFGHIGGVVTKVPAELTQSDRPVKLALEGCEPQVVWLMRALGGTIRAVEQLQQWLDRTPLEKTLFKKKKVLADVVKTLSDSKYESRVACPAPRLSGFKLDLKEAPPKFCPAKDERSTGDFWFFAHDKPAAVINILKGDPDACAPRISVLLFDSKGLARVSLHADWGGVMSANLLGDSCKSVDFDFNREKQAFVPTLKSCKP
jgi:hypothetical protein